MAGLGIKIFNSTASGTSFGAPLVDQVWAKGIKIEGRDSREWRLDVCGALIQRSKYGDTTKDHTGWEIDHIKPKAKKGTDALSNLQPLQWQNNRHKDDKYPWDPTDGAVSRKR